MNKLRITCLLFLQAFLLQGQSCFPDGITFSNQHQIDNFFVDYPDCSIIEGDVVIAQNFINNLVGLTGIKEIRGNLNINFESELSNLTGLNSLKVIGGDLRISYVNKLKNFEGLNNLQHIGGMLHIDINAEIENFVGFEQLKTIGGALIIKNNDKLVNISEFESLQTVQALQISENTLLKTIMGFPVLEKMESLLVIEKNESLIELSGFNNLEAVKSVFFIRGNKLLEEISGFDQLKEIEGTLEIIGNTNLKETNAFYNLKKAGSFKLGGNKLASLQNFQNLTVADGNFYLGEDSIKTLMGFEKVDSIIGAININNCIKLENLNGFETLDYVKGYLSIDYNPLLTNLESLSNLRHISEGLSISYNPLLKSLNGLDNLPSVKGALWIRNNNQLDDISAISQINPEEITELILTDNPKLSICHEESICQFLQIASENNATIQNNFQGCNSEAEVLMECAIVAATKKEQFEFKLQYMAESNSPTWGVYVRPKAGFAIGSNDAIVGSGQITIWMFNDELDSLHNIQSVNGIWNPNYSKVESPCEAPEISYISIGLQDGDGIVLENGKETLLFTFQIPTGCPDTLDLLDNNIDPFMRQNSEASSPRQDLFVFNTGTGRVHDWYGNYDSVTYSCEECNGDIDFYCPTDTLVSCSIIPDSTGYPIVKNQCSLDTMYYSDGNQIEACSDTTITFHRFWTLKNRAGQSYNCTQKITILKDFSKIIIPTDTILKDCMPIGDLTNDVTGSPIYLGNKLSTEYYQFGLLVFQSDEISSNFQIRRYFKIHDWCNPVVAPVDIGSQLITFPSIGDEDNDTVIDCMDLCSGGDDRVNSDGLGMPDDCDCDPNNPDDEFIEVNQNLSLDGVPMDSTYHASFQISASSNLNQDDSITFYAGHTIILKAGFYAPLGSSFIAAIDQDCSKKNSGLDKLKNSRLIYSKNKPEFVLDKSVAPLAMNIFPNPSRENTTISYYLPQKEQIKLRLYNSWGKEVRILQNVTLSKGRHQTILSSKNIISGVYYVSLQTGDSITTQKLLILNN